MSLREGKCATIEPNSVQAAPQQCIWLFSFLRSSLFGRQHYFIAVIIRTWGATEWALCKVCVRCLILSLGLVSSGTATPKKMAYICTHSFGCRHQRHDNNSIFTLWIRCLHSLFVMLFTNSTKAISIHSQWACARACIDQRQRKRRQKKTTTSERCWNSVRGCVW